MITLKKNSFSSLIPLAIFSTIMSFFFLSLQYSMAAVILKVGPIHYISLQERNLNSIQIKECKSRPSLKKDIEGVQCEGRYVLTETGEIVTKEVAEKDFYELLQAKLRSLLETRPAYLSNLNGMIKDKKLHFLKKSDPLKKELIHILLDPFATGTFLDITQSCLVKNLPSNDSCVSNNSSWKISDSEVTQLQWFFVTNENPSTFKEEFACPGNHLVINETFLCPSLPVENVSYSDIIIFLNKLRSVSKTIYRLPLKSEWLASYFAAADSQSWPLPWSKRIDDKVHRYAWFAENTQMASSDLYIDFYNGSPRSVRQKEKTFPGLYDLVGNVYEIVTNEKNEIEAMGGSWISKREALHVSRSLHLESHYKRPDIGFRLIREDNAKNN
jgi:hypothetical protein